MTPCYTLSPRAQADLEEIWDYTAHRWGIDQAEDYIRMLWRDIETLAENPSIGRECSEIRAGYRKFRSGSHVIFFRLKGRVPDVVRILHGRMDFDQHL